MRIFIENTVTSINIAEHLRLVRGMHLGSASEQTPSRSVES
jgi:hypothetical protein